MNLLLRSILSKLLKTRCNDDVGKHPSDCSSCGRELLPIGCHRGPCVGDEDSSGIIERLKERDVPFVIYSGFANLGGACAEAEHVSKPASPSVLLKGLLADA